MREKKLFFAAAVLVLFIYINLAFAADVTTLSVSGYAIYKNGTPFSGDIQAAINETGHMIRNATGDGRFSVTFTSLNLTSGRRYTLLIIAENSLIEKYFVA